MPRTRPPAVQLYFLHDGPIQFHTKEEQVVDQVAVEHEVAVTWLNARSAEADPYILKFNITELPTLVIYNARQQQLTRTVLLTGADLRSARQVGKWLEKTLHA